MAVVTYMNESFTCARAIKGPDYLRLLDESGVLVASFDGVSDFSGFAITEGSWEAPTDTIDANVAVMKEDGTLCTCGVPLKRFLRADIPTVLTRGVHYDDALPESGTEGQLFFLIV